MRRIAAFIASLLFASPALAAWTTGSTTTAARTVNSTTYTYDFTTATDSGTLNLSACGANLVTFDQSTGDSSTVAAIDLRACQSSTDTWQACTVLKRGPDNLPDAVATAIGAMPTAKPYALVHVATSPTGGDTARVTIVCSYDSTDATASGSYTPADPADWIDPDPTTVSGALDTLAGNLLLPSEIQNQDYTPASSGDWTAYYGTAPTTIRAALDQVAKKTRATLSQYDVIVDLDQNISFEPTNYTTGISASGAGANTGVVTSWASNECAQVQNAMNPYLTGAQHQWSVLLVGTLSTTWLNLKDAGAMRYCVGLIPANSIGTDGFPAPTVAKQSVGANNNDMLSVTWGNVEWQAAMTGQTEPAALWMQGGGLLFGHDGTGSGGNGNGGGLTNLTQFGNLTIRRTDDVDGSWAQGRPVNTNTSTFLESTTSTILYMSYATWRSDMTGLTMRLFGVGGDNDDIGFWSSSSWVTSYGRTKIEGLGTGAMWFESNSGTYNSWYFTNDDIGMMIGGDFVSGGDDPQISSCLCAAGACDPNDVTQSLNNLIVDSNCTATTARHTNGMRFMHPSIESVNLGMIASVDAGNEIEFYSLRTEVGSMLAHQIILGAGQCGNAVGTAMDYKLCAQDSDCDSSGTQCVTPGGTTTPFTDMTFFAALLPTDGSATGTTYATANCTATDTPHDCCTGSGTGSICPNWDATIFGESVGNNGAGQVNFIGSNISYSTSTGTDRYPFGISSSTNSANERFQIFVDSDSYWNDNITTILPSKMYHFATAKRYWFESTGEAALDGTDVGKCIATKGNDTTTGLVTCSTVSTAGVNYPIDNGSMFYERGGCMPTSGSNWVAGESVSFGVREVDSAGTLDAALGAAIKIPHDVADDLDASWLWKMETEKDKTSPLQALGVMGASDSAAFRLEMTAGSDGTGGSNALDGNEALSLQCFVDAVRLPVIRSQDRGYDY